MESFYENKNVFITGGTGILGKVIIESLIRKTEVKCIYMLIRAKKGKTAVERIQEMFARPLFAKVRQLKPHAHTLISPIHGDCAQSNLGISAEDCRVLTSNVDVVIHCAATINFNAPLYDAVIINVRATSDLLELAKKMLQLKSFVYISSAFANCVLSHIEEKCYTQLVGIGARQMLEMAELLGAELTNSLTVKLVRDFPNTYIFTKNLAEELIFSEGTTLPICILRPGIITSTYAEPTRGWIDSFAGVMGALMAIAQGSLRVIHLYSSIPAALVPVDFCANATLACGYRAGQRGNAEQQNANALTVYNCVPHERNLLSYGVLTKSAARYGKERPFSNTIWYPSILNVESLQLEKFLAIFLHVLPACFHDIWLLLRGKRRRMLHLIEKQQRFLNVVKYFFTSRWTFDTTNTQSLWSGLSAVDKLNFNFDMSAVIWDQYCRDIIFGMRQYLAVEDAESMPKAMRRFQRIKLAHYSIVALLLACLSLFVALLIAPSTLLLLWKPRAISKLAGKPVSQKV